MDNLRQTVLAGNIAAFHLYSNSIPFYRLQKCSNDHLQWRWNSQPQFKFGMQAGDFMMATNILLSGNNYLKIAHLFRYMNMRAVDETTFYRIQAEYLVDSIKSFWEDHRRNVLADLQGKDVVALGDGRMDSPGIGCGYQRCYFSN